MTILSTQNRVTLLGNGVTTSFSTTPVVFYETSDLKVYIVETATGDAELLVENTDYTVTGGDGATGSVNLAGGSAPYGAPSASYSVVIVRDVPLTQDADPENGDGSDAEVIERALDKLTIIGQQLDDRLGRSVTLPESDVTGASVELPTPEASTLLGWDDTGMALVNYAAGELSDDISVSSFMATVLNDADGNEAFQTLIDGTTTETAPAVGDLVVISDVSLSPDRARKITLSDLLKVINTLTAETAPAVGDKLPLYDADGNSTDAITLANLLKVVNGLTEDTLPDRSADYVLTYDTSGVAAAKVQINRLAGPLTIAANQALASNPIVTGIPATADVIEIAVSGMSTNGTAAIRLQGGTSSGLSTTTYEGSASSANSTIASTRFTNGLGAVETPAATGTYAGIIRMERITGNVWVMTATLARQDSSSTFYGASLFTAGGVVDRVGFVTTDTFDGGVMTVRVW